MTSVGTMSRVLLPLALGLAIAGCSLNNTPITASLGDGGGSDVARQTRAARQGALGGDPDSPRPSKVDGARGAQVAMLNDRAPSGSYEKAPRGALADRDYSATRLDPEKARELINAYRKQNGLKPLKLNAVLSIAAKEHSRDLAKWDRISHFGSDGSNPWDRVKRAGYNARIAAENVGTGQTSIDEVMKGWKESPGHNKNLLLADADHMGIALVQDPKTEFKTFWTLVLASPL